MTLWDQDRRVCALVCRPGVEATDGEVTMDVTGMSLLGYHFRHGIVVTVNPYRPGLWHQTGSTLHVSVGKSEEERVLETPQL